MIVSDIKFTRINNKSIKYKLLIHKINANIVTGNTLRVQMQKPLSAVWNLYLKWAFLSGSYMFRFSIFTLMVMYRSFSMQLKWNTLT